MANSVIKHDLQIGHILREVSTFIAPTTLSNIWYWTNQTGKDIYITVCFHLGYNNSMPKEIAISNNDIDKIVWHFIEESSGDISYSGKLTAGNTLYFQGKYDAEATNAYRVEGFYMY